MMIVAVVVTSRNSQTSVQCRVQHTEETSEDEDRDDYTRIWMIQENYVRPKLRKRTLQTPAIQGPTYLNREPSFE